MPKFRFEGTKDTPLGRTAPEAMARFSALGYSPTDFVEHFPCFASPKLLARFLTFYQCYLMTLGLSGHMAEVGVFRGAVSMFLAKLTLLYEPHATTQTHGFDWFREVTDGERTAGEDRTEYFEPFERIQEMIAVQGLQRWVLLHRLNVVTELEGFFRKHDHLQFKLVLLDAGDYQTVYRSIKEFWPRLTPGGIMIFDQFNHEVAPGESRAVKELLPDETVRAFPHGGMPTAYIVKGDSGRADGVVPWPMWRERRGVWPRLLARLTRP